MLTLRAHLSLYAPLFAAIALRLASEPLANLSYFLLATYALFGPAHAIRALVVSWLFTMINPGVAPYASVGSMARYAVLTAAVVGVFMQSGVRVLDIRLSRVVQWTILLGIFLILHAVAFSFMPDVSILKALSWTLAMATLLTAWHSLSLDERQKVEEELFLFLVLVLVAGLPLINHRVGYLTNGTGFQGILNQPQVFGVTVALTGAWSLARILSMARPRWSLFGIAGMCAALVLMSETRTAGLALPLGVLLSLAIYFVSGLGFSGRAIPGLRSKRLWLVVSLGIIVAVAVSPKIIETADHFITKSDRAQTEGIWDAYVQSRGVLFYPMLRNIVEQPLTGIGFGIASNPQEMKVSRDPILGVPFGAATEKGVLPLMVMEEVGLVGSIFVAMWLLLIVVLSTKGGLVSLTICVTTFILNMGEASFFSPGGMGMLSIIMVSMAATRGLRQKNAKMPSYPIREY